MKSDRKSTWLTGKRSAIESESRRAKARGRGAHAYFKPRIYLLIEDLYREREKRKKLTIPSDMPCLWYDTSREPDLKTVYSRRKCINLASLLSRLLPRFRLCVFPSACFSPLRSRRARGHRCVPFCSVSTWFRWHCLWIHIKMSFI